MRYFKAFWDESRSDDYDHWGTSWWYFKVHPDDYVIEQFQIYEDGTALWYGLENVDDAYGGLAEGNWSDNDQDAPIEEISESEFLTMCRSTSFRNTETY